MKSKTTSEVAKLLALAFTFIGISSTRAQYLQSPCPDVFTYQVDSNTNQIFGYVEISNIQVGQVAKLNIDLSIATQLAQNNVGSITLVKTREATFTDILHGNPAQYRVNFPLQNVLPTVLNIALNGQTICTGYRAQGRIITTINLEHTLYTELKPNGIRNNNGFQNQPPIDTNQLFYQQSHPVVRPKPQPQPRPTNPPQISYQPQTPRPNRERTTISPPVSSASFTCGKPSSSSLNRLSFNGERVDKGQFPWIVPLFDRDQTREPTYICGSTVISKRHLITAAHCIYEFDDFIKAERLLAIPGMYNIDNFADENAKFAYIESVHPHGDYDYEDDLNDADIVILNLKEVLTFSEYIIPICLWKDANDLERVVDQEGVVAGWGVTENGSTSIPTYIKAIIVSRKSCRDNVERMLPQNTRVFCGDGRGSAPCNGDSGSGFVLKRGNQYYLRGIVSKGQQDRTTLICDVNKFAIYTDVAPFRFWIRETMGL
ncbi:serine protease gd-like [Ochlerotatus camptorhynchus]|uniref:serine protease gd-like n=1 Tax=Ochlerotatus camptorhynchus TaxID=644619 RepID=UPI0031D262DC